MSSSSPTGPAHVKPLPIDHVSPQLTLRALLTGMVLGAVLSICNVYLGLLIGWGTNMSITGILIGYAAWSGVRAASGNRVSQFGPLENNINQSACSAAASVSSAGLVAPIPALAMLTGMELSWFWLSVWVFCVCLVGITVATGLRRQMILVDKLPFPSGLACAETLREIYGEGSEAIRRVMMLLTGAVVAAAVKITELAGVFKALPVPFTSKGYTSKQLGFEIEPNLLMVGVGGLIGFRAGASLLLGAILGWAILAPPLVRSGDIKLTTFETILSMPADLDIGTNAQEPMHRQLRYREARQRLEFEGVMTPDVRDRLVALSDDAGYRETVQRLFARSQLDRTVEWHAELPEEIREFPGIAVDSAAGTLTATAPISRAAAAELLSFSDDPQWHETVHAVTDPYRYTSTRPLRRSVRLADIPRGLTIPAEYAGRVQVVPDPAPDDEPGLARRLLTRLAFWSYTPAPPRAGLIVSWGAPPESFLREMTSRSEAWAGEPSRAEELSRRAEQRDRVLEAIETLMVPTDAPAFTPPAEVRNVVRYDRSAATLTLIGALDEGAADALVEAAAAIDPDLEATAELLIGTGNISFATANFGDLLNWLLWPGVTLMVVSSLVSFSFSWRSILRSFTGSRGARIAPEAHLEEEPVEDTGELGKKWFIGGITVALILSVSLQIYLFEILWWAAAVGVLLSFLLAIVAARVSGETNVTPVGAMGKVTQLIFGIMVPKNAAANLMSANVTGGAASQAADLMHDFKCGWLIGAAARKQVVSQVCGAFAGALVGSYFYIVLIPNPAEQLMTEEWPAPAVAAWRAVAELFMIGFEALPASARLAMLVAGILGVILPVLERVLPRKLKPFVPSAASIGLALVVSAKYAVSMFIGATIALILGKLFPRWSTRFLVTIAAGIIAGESLVGAGNALLIMLRSLV